MEDLRNILKYTKGEVGRDKEEPGGFLYTKCFVQKDFLSKRMSILFDLSGI